MLTPPHTPTEHNSANSNLHCTQIYEMELLRQRSNPIVSHSSTPYYHHHMQQKHETNRMAGLNHIQQIPLSVQQYHQQQHQMLLQAHIPNMQMQTNYAYQVSDVCFPLKIIIITIHNNLTCAI